MAAATAVVVAATVGIGGRRVVGGGSIASRATGAMGAAVGVQKALGLAVNWGRPPRRPVLSVPVKTNSRRRGVSVLDNTNAR